MTIYFEYQGFTDKNAGLVLRLASPPIPGVARALSYTTAAAGSGQRLTFESHLPNLTLGWRYVCQPG